MQPSRTEQLNGIVSALDEYISLVRAFQMEETAVLLDMAKLDLQMKIHSISDWEFHALCDALEDRHGSPRVHHAHNGELSPRPDRRTRNKILPLPIANPVDGILLEPHAAPLNRRRAGRTHRRARKGI
jgi:hypothetical protein